VRPEHLISRYFICSALARRSPRPEARPKNNSTQWRCIVSQKLSTLCLSFACFLGMTLTLWGQNAAAVRGVPGYLNPQAGAFPLLPHVDDQAVEAPAATTFGGKIVVNFTITVSSAIASTNKIGCNVGLALEDGLGTTSQNLIEETAGTAVTRGTGSTVTCSVTLPYSWKLTTSTTDSVAISYSIQSPVEITTAAAEYPLRTSIQSIATIKVPLNGATTTETVTTTI
jgi:hypothetical protein